MESMEHRMSCFLEDMAARNPSAKRNHDHRDEVIDRCLSRSLKGNSSIAQG